MDREKEPPYFGWLCTRLPLYPDTGPRRPTFIPDQCNQRPFIELEPTDHPLAVEQRNGHHDGSGAGDCGSVVAPRGGGRDGSSRSGE